MSDYEACADLCDDRGFARQAALLREVGAGRARAHVVEASRWTKEQFERVEDFDLDEAGESEPARETPRVVFLDREAAERSAFERSALALRSLVVPFDLSLDYDFRFVSNLSRDEFCACVSEILGRPYRLPEASGPLIPEPVTYAQLRRIVPLLNWELYTVVAVDIAP
jgi:hypothetical protein